MDNNVTQRQQANPLSKYFRQPAIYARLPSKGKFWPQESLDLPITDELPVYPMTARDEITLRTPDALMNGSGVVEVIQSCCPSIKDAWKMPSVDVDAILIAIRIASYGDTMDVESRCPHCNEDNTHAMELQKCLASIKCPDYTTPVEIDQLKIKLRPVAYFGVNKESSINFEEQKILQALEQANIEDTVRAAQILTSMNRLVDLNMDTITSSTEYIEVDDGTKVIDPGFIRDFYTNAPSTLVKTVQARLAEINQSGGVSPQSVTCGECNEPYSMPLLFDYAAFFGKGF